MYWSMRLTPTHDIQPPRSITNGSVIVVPSPNVHQVRLGLPCVSSEFVRTNSLPPRILNMSPDSGSLYIKFAATTTVETLHTTQTYYFNFLMQRQQPSTEEWSEVIFLVSGMADYFVLRFRRM